MTSRCRWLWSVLVVLSSPIVDAAEGPEATPSRGDILVRQYFANQTAQIQAAAFADIRTPADWEARRVELRRQLHAMLGLDPLPERTDLQVQVTGTVDHPEFTVEKLHFQSRPGLYVTANFYLPKARSGPVPAILYVCGHANVVKDGVSYGSKTSYQHHGAWFARNGYACLIIDTLQLGEIQGIHHGTYNKNRWWWMSRGYTPAGVEAWNCIRALDYLQTRPEVDPQRLGVTGRSGGGAYSWWISALDERIRAAVPVAGITDLHNYVVDGCVEGHCDCMFFVNTYRWDYGQVAALNFPRPLVISNTDRDGIFPLDGVYRLYSQVRRLYELDQKGPLVALNITSGGHDDTQELQLQAMHWFDQHLKGETRLIENAAKPFFEPQQLRVFQELPADELNTRIDETFVPRAAAPVVRTTAAEWQPQRDAWMRRLQETTFRGWPTDVASVAPELVKTLDHEGLTLREYQFDSQPSVPLSVWLVQRTGLSEPELVVLNPLDQSQWEKTQATLAAAFPGSMTEASTGATDDAAKEVASLRGMLTRFPWCMAYVAPRGVGPTRWNAAERSQTQIRRRFYLLGQTWEGMQAWDIRRAMQVVRQVDGERDTPLWLQAEGSLAALSLYASLFESPVQRLDLYALPTSHEPDGPALLNVLQTLDLPQTLTIAAERSRVVLYNADADAFQYATKTAAALNWPAKQIQFRSFDRPPAAKTE